MSRKRTFIKGAFLLTLTGIISRCIGFAYRIFLSQTFGAEGLALYQLIFPVYALCFACSTAGIETSIARTVSSKVAQNKSYEAKTFLLSSMLLSLFLSLICTVAVQQFAEPISIYFIQDARTYDLLILLSYAFPFASIHSCITGYYLGLKQTTIPSASQLIEQLIRVGGIFLLYQFCIAHQIACDISLAVIGLIIGEIASAIFCLFYITGKKQHLFSTELTPAMIKCNLQELFPLASPLTANRIVLNLLHSVEAVSIPIQLQVFGHSQTDALTIYGVLLGMALPCILFPTALTSAVSSMLLPTVAEIQAQNNKKEIKQVIFKAVQYCSLLGFACLISFFLFSDVIGSTLFHNEQVSSYLKALAWLCPFLYLNSNLLTIVNGLGKPSITFALNAISLLIRIGCIYLLIPHMGITGYLSGLLISQIFLTSGCAIALRKLCTT